MWVWNGGKGSNGVAYDDNYCDKEGFIISPKIHELLPSEASKFVAVTVIIGHTI